MGNSTIPDEKVDDGIGVLLLQTPLRVSHGGLSPCLLTIPRSITGRPLEPQARGGGCGSGCGSRRGTISVHWLRVSFLRLTNLTREK